MRYLSRTLITLAMITLSNYSYSQCGAPVSLWCDADTNGVVDINDIEAISAAKGSLADVPVDFRDIDEDGFITVLDARQCATRCDSTECADDLAACVGTEMQPERLFLQQLGPDSVIVKWRGNKEEGGAEANNLCFGTDQNHLLRTSKTWATVTATDHREVLLSGLDADTTYYYSVGGAGVADPSHSFHTAPEKGDVPADGNTRIWIVGDSGVGGTGSADAGLVRDGFLDFVAAHDNEPADLFLMLGDNAYNNGTDVEHQAAVFDVYPQILATTPLWPTIGNHEMGGFGVTQTTSTDDYPPGMADPAPDSPMPYLNIFSLPSSAEIGGNASGTEQYYSFDYGNVHIVSLDSQVAIRDADNRAIMLQWLKDDLTMNSLNWTIVIFHHPPYTKGSHNSDSLLGGIDQPIFAIREEFTPVFEDYGVDLAYSGHSHIYERSLYINGHYGLSPTFDPGTPPMDGNPAVPGMAELNDDGFPASGQEDDGEAYTQVAKNTFDDKVVYTVAGNGGKVTITSQGYPHPAHFFSQPADELDIGSVVIDLGANRLEASFIDINGAVLDSFVMTR
jgi:hypothetical protein